MEVLLSGPSTWKDMSARHGEGHTRNTYQDRGQAPQYADHGVPERGQAEDKIA